MYLTQFSTDAKIHKANDSRLSKANTAHLAYYKNESGTTNRWRQSLRPLRTKTFALATPFWNSESWSTYYRHRLITINVHWCNFSNIKGGDDKLWAHGVEDTASARYVPRKNDQHVDIIVLYGELLPGYRDIDVLGKKIQRQSGEMIHHLSHRLSSERHGNSLAIELHTPPAMSV